MTVSCPFCNSEDVEILSPWGSQIITCQARCHRCKTYFEAIREEFEGAPETTGPWTTNSAGDP
jgi:hypothetical protein